MFNRDREAAREKDEENRPHLSLFSSLLILSSLSDTKVYEPQTRKGAPDPADRGLPVTVVRQTVSRSVRRAAETGGRCGRSQQKFAWRTVDAASTDSVRSGGVEETRPHLAQLTGATQSPKWTANVAGGVI